MYHNRPALYPIKYEWALKAFEDHERCHWVFDSVPLAADVSDYHKVDPKLAQLIKDILFLFTQSDVDIGRAYYERYIPLFKDIDLRSMMGSFANREATHYMAYSLLNRTLGLPDSSFVEFLNIKPMYEKHHYLERIFDRPVSQDPAMQYAEIAIFSGFVEGFSLFSSFSILAAFGQPSVNMFQGIKQIVKYSSQEENIHYINMLKLAKVLREEHPGHDWTTVDNYIETIVIPDVWQNEVNFVNYLFRDIKEGEFHIDAKMVINFLGHILNDRANDLGVKLSDKVEYDESDVRLLNLFNDMMGLVQLTNFFESKGTDYVRGGVVGHIDDLSFQD